MLERDVNAWLKSREGKIEVIERKFAMCPISDEYNSADMVPHFGYCIVYREK